MSKGYENTIDFWNEIFQESPIYNPNTMIPIKEVEEGLVWLSEGCKKILDFGCGNGRCLLRCGALGVESLLGVDISFSAIKLGKKVAQEFDIKKAKFRLGSIDLIKDIEDGSIDGVILFNIIDNMYPKDSINLLEEIQRILRPKGKILFKVNDYIERDICNEWGFKELEQDFYNDNSGLYLWNLSKEKLNVILTKDFQILKYQEVTIPKRNTINRMYYLIKKDSTVKP